MYCNKTNKSPEILLDIKKGILNINGNCYDDLSINKLEELTDNLKNNNINRLICNIKFNIINSLNHKNMFIILIYLSDLYMNNIPIIINWYYNKNDISIKEMGDDFNELLDIDLNIIEQ